MKILLFHKSMSSDATPLPTFRRDLKLFRATNDAYGAPTYSLYDPITAKYFKVSWFESLILKYYKPGMTAKDLKKQIEENSTAKIKEDEIVYFFKDAVRSNLTMESKTSEELIEAHAKTKQNPFMWMVFHYLYFRIPVFKPDAFLKRTLKYVTPLFSFPAKMFYITLTLLGLIMVIPQFEDFISTFSYFFNPKGVFIYAVAITLVKVLHELGHAYTAAYLGVHIPSIGLAFLVLWPVLYTNVTDSWKLINRKHRFYISVAGIVVELVIAGLATFFWCFLENGMMKSICFVLASAGWISSLFVNLNPAMRFDGYYILGDIWGIENLQPRAFAVFRWQYRKWFFGIDTGAPEERLSSRRITGMVIYSLFTLIYRVILYITIAIFVYVSFTKVLGIGLFFFEIAVFLAWPLVTELKDLFYLREKLRANLRIFSTCTIVALAFLWFVLPFRHWESFPAITIPDTQQVIYVPGDGVIKHIYAKRGDYVQPGQQIALLESRDLENEIKTSKIQAEILSRQLKVANINENNRSIIPQKRAELRAIRSKINGLEAKVKELDLHAIEAGLIYAFDEKYHAGQSISKDQILGYVSDPTRIHAICYVPENLVDEINLGDEVIFHLRSTHERIPGYVVKKNPSRTDVLEFEALASVNSGDIPVTEGKEGVLQVIDTYFAVEVALDGSDSIMRFGNLGDVEIEGPPKSKAVSFYHYLKRLLRRESSF